MNTTLFFNHTTLTHLSSLEKIGFNRLDEPDTFDNTYIRQGIV
ncbi:MAG TPA: hypothetical protein VMW77_06155 [Methanoregula sp.]|nr:hypothetical protein [Methanoregula sp.]